MNFYVDFEATQFSERIISFGCVAEDGESFCSLVQPLSNWKITSFITELTGITDDMVKDAPELTELIPRLKEIFDAVSSDSMILLDESLSSTGSYEASYIAAEILTGFSAVKCRTLFSTHLHELAAMLDEINEKCAAEGGAPIDTLVAGIDEGKRSFKIYRAKPDGKSYARDIADKYGLSLDKIMEKIK